MPAGLRRSPLFRPGVVGQGNTAFDGTNEHYTTVQCGSPLSVKADGGGVQFLAIQKTTYWKETFRTWSLSGQTLDATSTPLAGCNVDALSTTKDVVVSSTVSDGSGNFTHTIGYNSDTFYMVAYKQGSPDVAGTTVNTLTVT